jgi:hypothetical protein
MASIQHFQSFLGILLASLAQFLLVEVFANYLALALQTSAGFVVVGVEVGKFVDVLYFVGAKFFPN